MFLAFNMYSGKASALINQRSFRSPFNGVQGEFRLSAYHVLLRRSDIALRDFIAVRSKLCLSGRFLLVLSSMDEVL